MKMKLTPAERLALEVLAINLSQITRDGSVLRVPVTTTMGGEIVYADVPRAELLAWCERRFATRATHKNRCLRSTGAQGTHYKAMSVV